MHNGYQNSLRIVIDCSLTFVLICSLRKLWPKLLTCHGKNSIFLILFHVPLRSQTNYPKVCTINSKTSYRAQQNDTRCLPKSVICEKKRFFFNGTNDFFEDFFSLDLVGPIELIL